MSFRRLLFFAYFYPPLGGPAVQRPCKTVKYLTELGWQVDVITVKDIIYHSIDHTLEKECRQQRIFRTFSLDPMHIMKKIKKLLSKQDNNLYFTTELSWKNLIKRCFPIDEKIGWLPFAINAGIKAIRTTRYDAVMVTGNPFSSFLAGYFIAKKTKALLILDYRDHWTLNPLIPHPKGFMFKLLQNLERFLLNSADLITTASKFIKTDLIQQFGKHLDNKIQPIYNGWDKADFGNYKCNFELHNPLRIYYLGSIYPNTSLTPFFDAVKRYNTNHPNNPLTIQFVGNYFVQTRKEIAESGLVDNIHVIPHQSHNEAIRIMSEADILLLCISDNNMRWSVTGKLFEYLRSQKPILALVPYEGEAAAILSQCGHKAICPVSRTDLIYNTIDTLISDILSNKSTYIIPFEYERSRQISILHEKICSLLANH